MELEKKNPNKLESNKQTLGGELWNRLTSVTTRSFPGLVCLRVRLQDVTLVGQAELTVENKSKQPSLLMTQYTSGRRGPFPVGWKREEQNWLDQSSGWRCVQRLLRRFEFTPLKTRCIAGRDWRQSQVSWSNAFVCCCANNEAVVKARPLPGTELQPSR